MSEEDDIGVLSIDEILLVRLLRALDSNVREFVYARTLGAALGLRSGQIDRFDDADWQEIEDRLFQERPADWPGRSVVDLDDLGDPGKWLRDGVAESWLYVLLRNQEDEENAAIMAESYAESLIANGYPMPSDFDEHLTWEAEIAMFQAEFAAFLRSWRQRILRVIKLNSEIGSDTLRGNLPETN